jgi:peroxiredoxin
MLKRLALIVGMLGLASAEVLAGTPGSVNVGDAAPAFSLRDRSRGLIALSDYVSARRPKQVVVIDFFRTDCKPCRSSMPKLRALAKDFTGKPVKFIMVALLEDQEGRSKLNAFLQRNPVPFPVLVDAYGVVAKKYIRQGNGVKLPALFVIGPNGKVEGRFGYVGAEEYPKLKAHIGKLAAPLKR